jgi:hypothetical protein
MATPYPPLISRTTKSVDWMMDYELEQADNASLAAYDRRLEIERSVTFEELIEEVASFTAPRAQLFMEAFREGAGHDKFTLWLLLDQARDRIVEKKLKEPS